RSAMAGKMRDATANAHETWAAAATNVASNSGIIRIPPPIARPVAGPPGSDQSGAKSIAPRATRTARNAHPTGAAGHGAMATAMTSATTASAVTPRRARSSVLPTTSSRERYVRTEMYAVRSTGAKAKDVGTDFVARDMGMEK